MSSKLRCIRDHVLLLFCLNDSHGNHFHKHELIIHITLIKWHVTISKFNFSYWPTKITTRMYNYMFVCVYYLLVLAQFPFWCWPMVKKYQTLLEIEIQQQQQQQQQHIKSYSLVHTKPHTSYRRRRRTQTQGQHVKCDYVARDDGLFVIVFIYVRDVYVYVLGNMLH